MSSPYLTLQHPVVHSCRILTSSQASGNIGIPITKALLAAGFKVTAITRESSNSTFPENVDVRKANLTSVESVAKALSGQDAVVIAIASAAVAEQIPIVDGALAAGVKRVIPSEFGHNPEKIKHPVLSKLLTGKTKIIEHLRELSKANPSFTWTGVATEPFFDWVCFLSTPGTCARP